MANNSTYIKLTSSILLEYEYRDQNIANVDNIFTTTACPWLLMDNGHDNSVAVFNADNTTQTGNLRTRMGTPTDVITSQYGYLALDGLQTLNDYDPDLTDTVNLPVTFSVNQPVNYDVVRLHLVQGFNFEGNQEGFQFRLSFDNNDGQKVRYLNLAYRKSDDYAQINPEPFLFGGKYYASYIEIKVPNLFNLINDYATNLYSSVPVADLPVVRLSGGSGPELRSLIRSDFSWIPTNKEINGQQYAYSYDWITVDLPTLDQFANLSAECAQATNGDYIELYAAWNGDIIDNFISQLNNVPGNDYIILHDLNVYEYVWPSGASAYWMKTSGLEFVQDSNYAEPILYRPVIQNQSATAYRIDYTIRLFNREDSSSIWKNASVVFNNALKYGRYFTKINLGANPIQPKVYNQIVDKSLNWNGKSSTDTVLSNETEYSRYVTAFLQSNNVTLAAQNAFIQRNPTTGEVQITSVGNSKSEIIYAQGLGRFNMSNSDTFVKFVIYKGDANSQVAFMDLTGLGRVELNFFADSGEQTKFLNYRTPDVSEASGEILFKVPAKDSQRISEYTNKTFTITSDNGDAISELYTGKFVKAGDAVKSYEERKDK